VTHHPDRKNNSSYWAILMGSAPTPLQITAEQPSQRSRQRSIYVKLILIRSRLRNVMVSVLVIRPKVRGFKTGQGIGFLRAIEIRSTTFFGGEVKPSAPRLTILRHVKISCKYE
jgi:hypothetical protein